MLLNLILIFTLLSPVSSTMFSGDHFFNIVEAESAIIPVRINVENVGVKVSAERFVAIDVASGKLLLQKDADTPQPIASITKLMTALVILDQSPNWESVVKMERVDETRGAQPHVYRGEEIKFIDLWKLALVSSDNNAIMAMIRSLTLSREEFVELMNQKAKILAMHNTTFADPTGLNEKNLSTAQDIARLLHFAMQSSEISESVLQGKYEFNVLNRRKKRTVYNTDILVDSFLNKKEYGYKLIGGKTGYLPEAGYCLAVEIAHSEHPVIIVVLDSENISSRFQDVKAVADWVFSNYEWQ